MFYKECPICGASLDPGEKCDCEKKEACTAATEQTSNVNNSKNLQTNYTTKEGALSR